jgi:hypothetical protein
VELLKLDLWLVEELDMLLKLDLQMLLLHSKQNPRPQFCFWGKREREREVAKTLLSFQLMKVFDEKCCFLFCFLFVCFFFFLFSPPCPLDQQSMSGFDQNLFKSSNEFSFDQPQSPFGKVAQDAFAARPPSPKKVDTDWESHVMLPLIITGYVQAVFNFVVVLAVLFCFYWFASAIQQDIDLKSESFRREVMSEIQSCARDYNANRCEPSDRIPAMQKMCETWKNCMSQG